MLASGVNGRMMMVNEHTYQFSQSGEPWLWPFVPYTINMLSVFTKFTNKFPFEQEDYI